jgi:hypothetical protein
LCESVADCENTRVPGGGVAGKLGVEEVAGYDFCAFGAVAGLRAGTMCKLSASGTVSFNAWVFDRCWRGSCSGREPTTQGAVDLLSWKKA